MSVKFKPPTIPLPEKSKKWNRPDMDGYVVFDSDIKRLEKKANSKKIAREKYFNEKSRKSLSKGF